MQFFLKSFVILTLFTGPVASFACGEKDACPASSCEKKRCLDYIERKGEYANRLRLRCIDLCHSACSELLRDELKACTDKKSDSTSSSEAEED